jgi:hypothetical protein
MSADAYVSISARKMELMTSVFATSNNIEKIIIPLQSRFFIPKLQNYAYEQFYQIAVRILTSSRYQVDGEIAEVIAQTVWTTSKNIRDCIKIAGMAKSVEDVKWLVTTFQRMIPWMGNQAVQDKN